MANVTASNKISIYPFEVTIEAEGGPYKAHVYRIEEVGMILEVFVNTFNPHQSLKLKWVLPVDNVAMQEDVVVVKKYSQARNGKIQYLMEVHFKKLSLRNSQAIKSLFERLEKLSQKQNQKKTAR